MLPPTPPSLVLDTNVVLDWLVFRDPSCLALGEAIESGSVRWLAASDLREEWDAVLGRGVGSARAPDLAAIDQIWQRHAVMAEPARQANAGVRQRCRCSDPDDQKFIDLALRAGATWLLSRDRAVLKLAREARRFGLQIVAPTRWTMASALASG